MNAGELPFAEDGLLGRLLINIHESFKEQFPYIYSGLSLASRRQALRLFGETFLRFSEISKKL
jgi:hypothetical protein